MSFKVLGYTHFLFKNTNKTKKSCSNLRHLASTNCAHPLVHSYGAHYVRNVNQLCASTWSKSIQSSASTDRNQRVLLSRTPILAIHGEGELYVNWLSIIKRRLKCPCLAACINVKRLKLSKRFIVTTFSTKNPLLRTANNFMVREFNTEYPVLQFANHCTFMKSFLNIQCYNFAKYFKLKEFLIDYPRL
jgi:hypothetical protein